jgi:hypothetical protein
VSSGRHPAESADCLEFIAQSIEFELPTMAQCLPRWIATATANFLRLPRRDLLRLPPPVLCRMLESERLALPPAEGEDAVLTLLIRYLDPARLQAHPRRAAGGAVHAGEAQDDDDGRQEGQMPGARGEEVGVEALPAYPPGWGVEMIDGGGGDSGGGWKLQGDACRELWLCCRFRWCTPDALTQLGPQHVTRYGIPPQALTQALQARLLDAAACDAAAPPAAAGVDAVSAFLASPSVYFGRALQPRACQAAAAARRAGVLSVHTALAQAQAQLSEVMDRAAHLKERATTAEAVAAREREAAHSNVVCTRELAAAQRHAAAAEAQLIQEAAAACVERMVAHTAEAGAAQAVAALLAPHAPVSARALPPSSTPHSGKRALGGVPEKEGVHHTQPPQPTRQHPGHPPAAAVLQQKLAAVMAEVQAERAANAVLRQELRQVTIDAAAAATAATAAASGGGPAGTIAAEEAFLRPARQRLAFARVSRELPGGGWANGSAPPLPRGLFMRVGMELQALQHGRAAASAVQVCVVVVVERCSTRAFLCVGGGCVAWLDLSHMSRLSGRGWMQQNTSGRRLKKS